MKNIILVIDRVEAGLVNACKKVERKLGYKLQGIRLVSNEYKQMADTTYAPDTSGFFKEIVVDYNDPNQLQKVLKDIKDHILVVNCRDESSMQAFAKVIPFIPNVPTPNESTLKWATEKNLMRDRLAAYNEELVPKYLEFPENMLPELEKQVKDFTFPVIVKPAGLNTSMLVDKCENMSELKACLVYTYEIIHDIYRQQRGHGKPVVLIEEFINGQMYSVDAYALPDGKKVICLPPVKVTTAHDVGLKGFYGYQQSVPSDLDKADEEKAKEVATEAVLALNLRSCTAHVEMYKTTHGWKIIELGARIGGHRQVLYELAYGIDHYYNDLASRIEGLNLELDLKPIAVAVCDNIYPQKAGFIQDFKGIDEARKLPTNKYVRQLADVGDFVQPAERGGLYYADAVFVGKDKAAVMADAKKARELIKVEVGSHED